MVELAVLIRSKSFLAMLTETALWAAFQPSSTPSVEGSYVNEAR